MACGHPEFWTRPELPQIFSLSLRSRRNGVFRLGTANGSNQRAIQHACQENRWIRSEEENCMLPNRNWLDALDERPEGVQFRALKPICQCRRWTAIAATTGRANSRLAGSDDGAQAKGQGRPRKTGGSTRSPYHREESGPMSRHTASRALKSAQRQRAPPESGRSFQERGPSTPTHCDGTDSCRGHDPKYSHRLS